MEIKGEINCGLCCITTRLYCSKSNYSARPFLLDCIWAEKSDPFSPAYAGNNDNE